jgi:hypothetical protein
MYVFMYVCMYVCMYVYVYVFTYIDVFYACVFVYNILKGYFRKFGKMVSSCLIIELIHA